MADSIVNKITKLMGFQLIGTMFVTLGLFVFAVFNDEIMYRLYEVVLYLQTTGLYADWVVNFVDSMQSTVFQIPVWLDLMFFVLAITFIAEIWISAYYCKREGYVSMLGSLTLGILVALLFMGIITQISSWFQDVFLGLILPNLTFTNTWFTLYSNNVLIINVFVIAVAVVINFIDFDFKTFNLRKKPEIDTQEVV